MYEGKGLLVHSGWDPYTFDNDIALIYLATAVPFTRNNYYIIICLRFFPIELKNHATTFTIKQNTSAQFVWPIQSSRVTSASTLPSPDGVQR